MVRILIGALFIVGGLSGRMVLIGTQSNVALIVVGGAMVLWGLFQVMSRRS